jgi:Putative abortive phage resistance protein AbiGi, antitoxin
MAEYISEELFHFVGQRHPHEHELNFETLLKIINSGCVSSEPPKIGWGPTTVHLNRGAKLEHEKLAVSNITCYCDIPPAAFSRHLLTKFGARPVLYIPMRADDFGSPYGTTLLRDIQAVLEGFLTQLHEPNAADPSERSRRLTQPPTTPLDAVSALRSVLLKDFLAYIKPYDSELSVHSPHYYYAEREWRRIGGLMFSLADIQTIAVASGYETRLRIAVPRYRGRVIGI